MHVMATLVTLELGPWHPDDASAIGLVRSLTQTHQRLLLLLRQTIPTVRCRMLGA